MLLKINYMKKQRRGQFKKKKKWPDSKYLFFSKGFLENTT